MKTQQLSREARLRRALERWENEGGRGQLVAARREGERLPP